METTHSNFIPPRQMREGRSYIDTRTGRTFTVEMLLYPPTGARALICNTTGEQAAALDFPTGYEHLREIAPDLARRAAGDHDESVIADVLEQLQHHMFAALAGGPTRAMIEGTDGFDWTLCAPASGVWAEIALTDWFYPSELCRRDGVMRVYADGVFVAVLDVEAG